MSDQQAAEQPVEPAPGLRIRRLAYPDLPQVIAIERRVFPTPWSLAMFVLELSKQSGVCLAATLPAATVAAAQPGGAARDGDAPRGITRAVAEDPLVAYLICSRYDTVWHVMNIAVDNPFQRRGLASALLAELYEQVGDENARFTLEVRRSNAVAIHLYEREGFRAAGLRRRYYQDNGEDALVMWRTPATLAGSLDDVPNARPL
jgi:ribosomal-protein-alanine N-acetyltransferase